MIYYPHYIADFNSATRHCSRLERGIYRDMRDVYFETEQPLPLDTKALFRKILVSSPEEISAAEMVLADFFQKTAQGWFSAECALRIQDYYDKQDKSAKGGKAKAENAARKRDEELVQAARKLEAELAQTAGMQQAEFEALTSIELAGSESLPHSCQQDADVVLAPYEQSSRSLLAGCEKAASTVLEGANQNQNQNQSKHQNQHPPQPTLSIDRAGGVTAVQLSIALREHGVKCQPADPQLIALAEQGVTVDVVAAACIDGKRSKAGQPINLGYVVGILRRWTAEAGAIKAGAVAAQPARTTAGQHLKFDPVAHVNRHRVPA